MRHHRVILSVLFSASVTVLLSANVGVTLAADGGTIAKCRDANGKWHYGDFAADACEQSKITHIDQQGIHVKEIVVPPTRAEINARRAAEERKLAERKRVRDQQAKDRRLLSKYESIEDIERSRDTRLMALDADIKTEETLLSRLQDRQLKMQKYAKSSARHRRELKVLDEQIVAYERSIAGRTEERSRVIQRFGSDLERYRAVLERLQSSAVDEGAD